MARSFEMQVHLNDRHVNKIQGSDPWAMGETLMSEIADDHHAADAIAYAACYEHRDGRPEPRVVWVLSIPSVWLVPGTLEED